MKRAPNLKTKKRNSRKPIRRAEIFNDKSKPYTSKLKRLIQIFPVANLKSILLKTNWKKFKFPTNKNKIQKFPKNLSYRKKTTVWCVKIGKWFWKTRSCKNVLARSGNKIWGQWRSAFSMTRNPRWKWRSRGLMSKNIIILSLRDSSISSNRTL